MLVLVILYKNKSVQGQNVPTMLKAHIFLAMYFVRMELTFYLFVNVEVLRPSQSIGVMSSNRPMNYLQFTLPHLYGLA